MVEREGSNDSASKESEDMYSTSKELEEEMMIFFKEAMDLVRVIGREERGEEDQQRKTRERKR